MDPEGFGSCEKAHFRTADLSLAIRVRPSQNCTGDHCPVRHKALAAGNVDTAATRSLGDIGRNSKRSKPRVPMTTEHRHCEASDWNSAQEDVNRSCSRAVRPALFSLGDLGCEKGHATRRCGRDQGRTAQDIWAAV